mmetsp:Transcript_12772/g.18837  ORF Transcript_12772/g.18837 Transcript_12772/m.18837 type:complete len:164 (-) Transcript_12772:906-1397(-)
MGMGGTTTIAVKEGAPPAFTNNPDVVHRIFSFLLEWENTGGSKCEDHEICLPDVSSLRATCRLFHRAFDTWGGWQRLGMSLYEEKRWKKKQDGNLSYALDCRVGTTQVGMLRFETKDECNEFMVSLRDRIVRLERRLTFLGRKLQNPLVAAHVPRAGPLFDFL